MTADERFLALGKAIPPPMQIPAGLSVTQARLPPGLTWPAGHGPNREKTPPSSTTSARSGAS